MVGSDGQAPPAAERLSRYLPEGLARMPRIPESAVDALKHLALEYREATRPFFPKPDAWRHLDQDGAWKHFVYQVAVVGDSSAYDRLVASSQAQRELHFDHLERLGPEERRETVHRVLRTYRVRYAAADPQKCRKTSALVRNLTFLSDFRGGPLGYLASLASIAEEESRVNRVAHDMCYIKHKGARDLLAELGLAVAVVALDTRLITILNRLGVSTAPDLQTNPQRYADFERELLSRVCAPLGITGVELDRILYRNYDAIVARLPAEAPN
jgi:hypothetical protein